MVMDSGYKTPWIAKKLLEDDITPIMPYKRGMTKKGYFRKYEYVYDKEQDTYLCPAKEVLAYCTTNRDGYRMYKSDGTTCKTCDYLYKCTGSKDHKKVVTRHVWAEYMEKVEEIRHRKESKEVYARRKESIERVFAVAKEHHNMRYTNQIGKEAMELKVALTLACINMKKLANMRWNYRDMGPKKGSFFRNIILFIKNVIKRRPIATCFVNANYRFV